MAKKVNEGNNLDVVLLARHQYFFDLPFGKGKCVDQFGMAPEFVFVLHS